MYITTTTVSTVSLEAPTAHITVNRNRIKSYPGNTVYIKDRTHFEIELHNPRTSPVLAKISLNGKAISSSGIILKPGQRVYLERWLDDAKKFLFETYEVENSDSAKKAIENNGEVKVEFYDEVTPLIQNHYCPPNNWWNQPYVQPTDFWYSGTPTVMYGSGSSGIVNCNLSGSNTTTISSNNATFTSSVPTMNSMQVNSSNVLRSTSLETGRAEKGESSSQQLISASGNFNSWTCAIASITILPESQKPAEVNVRHYCPSCGTRMKSSAWKFCPSCGKSVTE